jgi:hypothetical protein
MHQYRTLDAAKVIATQTRLIHRVAERFPGSGLDKVAREVLDVAQEASTRVERIGSANWPLRGLIALLLLSGAGLVLATYSIGWRLSASNDLLSALQGVDAGIHLLAVAGAIVFFLTTYDAKLARDKALAALHELRSLVHVIDMHQLTKDPSALAGPRTSASPDRPMSPFEIKRYLDYCSEMVSICGKIAALYAQGVRDPIVVDAVSDVERLTTGISQKIWQKIAVLEAVTGEHVAASAPAAGQV